MVMSGDNFLADVVFLIEATAHISPYAESLKTNYIIPTLEYFSGTLSDERDCGSENNFNSTLYGIVAFSSNDCKPDSSSVCYAPTSNSNTFLTWLDKIQFIGGGGNPSSHIVEGLSTAINLLDDFRKFRENASPSDMASASKSSKHCILICNSTPYMEPAFENPIYCGYTIDQLMNVMHEKEINFSIFSPRKIQFLYNLFENAGGNLVTAQMKNYAKDRRHLVLLNGFHLQEKPMSPSSQPSSTEQEKQFQGIKRPLSPSSNANLLLSNQQMIVRNAQLNSLISNETTQFGQQAARGGSPSVNHWATNGNVPSPQAPRNPPHAPVRQRASTPQLPNIPMMNPIPSPGQISNLVPQVSPASKPVQVNPSNVALRPNNPNLNQIRPQQMQSPFSAPQAPSPSQPQPSPMNIRAVSSPIPNSAQSPISQSQPFIQQQQINQINPQQLGQINQISQGQNVVNQMNNIQANMNTNVSTILNNQRTRIWSGVIEYHDKIQPQGINNQQQQKMSYHLECHITYQPNNNEPEFTADRWPEKLLINTVPKLLINRLSPIFKNNSYHVNFHFTGDSPGLQKLLKAMSVNSVGCIQLPNPANIRIIIVLYMPDKKVFVGFIPHNQDEFMTSMKELIESHKKEQQVKQQQQKQQMLSHMQMTIGHQQQIQQQGQSISSNQAPNTQPQLAQMSGPLSIQISHGQMGQSAPGNTSQIISSNNNANAMFQLQQMSSNSSLQPNPNVNISTVAQSGPVQIPQSNTSTQGGSMLLSQSLNAIPNTNQVKNSVFIGNTASNANLATATTNSGIQITLNTAPNTAINQMQQANHQPSLPTMGQQIIQQNPPNQAASGQQFNMMANSPQMNIPANASRGYGDREQNLMTIKQLEMTLKEAQRKEMEYQQQQQVQVPVDPPKPGQMIPNTALQQQPQQNNAVRQHLQHQLQQKQMIHLQQQQQQQQQHQTINNNLQLRHLLQQQQQLRNMNPTRMQTSVGVPHQTPQQQTQILLQQSGQIPQQQQQQQFRFQNSVQSQQQPVSQTAGQQQHTRTFFDESLY